MHSFQNFIVRLIPNHPPPLETRIWKLVVRALLLHGIIAVTLELKENWFTPICPIPILPKEHKPVIFRSS